jgi:hypothetical protein
MNRLRLALIGLIGLFAIAYVTIKNDPPIPAPHPQPDRSFHLAAHTLLLDESIAQLAQQAGFDSVVQVFAWRDINLQPGVYAWSITDDMVDYAQARHLDLIVRLDMPPYWATRVDPAGLPFDLAAYLDFVDALATRYRGRILGYTIWNEPNLAEEWGGWVAAPRQYVDVLCQAFTRLRQIDPKAKVIAAGLAPTNEYSYRAMDDRAFLQQMMSSGAAQCFDVLAAHDYGYGLPPTDPHGEHAGLNLARLIDLHNILVAANAPQPIWITELGYTIQSGLHPDVSPADQASYLLGAFERVRTEWPWVEMFTVWNLSYMGGDDEMQGFSIINPDQSPRLAFQLIGDMRQHLAPAH